MEKERYAEIRGMEKMYAAEPEFSFWGIFYHIIFLQAEVKSDENTGELEKTVILELENMDRTMRAKILFEGVSLFYMAGLDSVGGFDIDKERDVREEHGRDSDPHDGGTGIRTCGRRICEGGFILVPSGIY